MPLSASRSSPITSILPEEAIDAAVNPRRGVCVYPGSALLRPTNGRRCQRRPHRQTRDASRTGSGAVNRGKVPRFLIAVQSGGRLGEDDIVRFEALYERDREPAAPAG